MTDLIECVFKLGFSRSTNYYESFNLTWELKLSGCVFAFIFAILVKDLLAIGNIHNLKMAAKSKIAHPMLPKKLYKKSKI